METLQQQIEALINEHGAEAFSTAVKEHSTTPIAMGGTVPTCPKGYYWNGNSCILDVG